MIFFPNAKINIGLNVVSKRPDGYHNLETIFYPVSLSDALEIVPAKSLEFTTSGIQIDGDPFNNLVLKAYHLIQTDFDIPPVNIHLDKRIPFGAGLGGGSSDAANTLLGLNKLFNLQLSDQILQSYAAKIGADCPFFIKNEATFASGIGNQFESVNLDLADYKIVIAKPNIAVSTVEAYRNIVPKKSDFDFRQIAAIKVEEWRNILKNDFEESVFPLFPEIENLKNTLYNSGALYASMSGSGSAVYAIFRHLPVNLDKFIPKGIFIYR